jgi:hypothetical protein
MSLSKMNWWPRYQHVATFFITSVATSGSKAKINRKNKGVPFAMT